MTLTAGEVAALEQVELPVGGYLDNARQLFLFACYTGLRCPDLLLNGCLGCEEIELVRAVGEHGDKVAGRQQKAPAGVGAGLRGFNEQLITAATYGAGADGAGRKPRH